MPAGKAGAKKGEVRATLLRQYKAKYKVLTEDAVARTIDEIIISNKKPGEFALEDFERLENSLKKQVIERKKKLTKDAAEDKKKNAEAEKKRREELEEIKVGESPWGLITRYEIKQYETEKKAMAQKVHARQGQYRKLLDEQMEEAAHLRMIHQREEDRQRTILEEKLRRHKQEEKDKGDQAFRDRVKNNAASQAQEARYQQRKIDVRDQKEADRVRLIETVTEMDRQQKIIDDSRKNAALRRAVEMKRAKEEAFQEKKQQRADEAAEAKKLEREFIERDDARMAERAAQEKARWDKIAAISNTVGKAVGNSLEAKAAEDERVMVKAMKEKKRADEAADAEKARIFKENQQETIRTLARQQQERRDRRQGEKDYNNRLQAQFEADASRYWKKEADDAKQLMNDRRAMDEVLKKQIEWEERPEDERLRPDLAKVENEFTMDYLRKIARNPEFSEEVAKWLK